MGVDFFSNREDLPDFFDSIKKKKKMALIRVKGVPAIGNAPGQVAGHLRWYDSVLFAVPQMNRDIDVFQVESPWAAV